MDIFNLGTPLLSEFEHALENPESPFLTWLSWFKEPENVAFVFQLSKDTILPVSMLSESQALY